MKYSIEYKFSLYEERELISFLDGEGYEIDYLNSKINSKIVRDKKTNKYVGTVKIFRNDENDEVEYQWWEPVPHQYIRMNEASAITGLKASTIRNLVYSGSLKAYKQGKFLVFNIDELKEWVTNRTKAIEKVKSE